MRHRLTKEDIEKLEDTLYNAKQTAPTRPYPMAPDSKQTIIITLTIFRARNGSKGCTHNSINGRKGNGSFGYKKEVKYKIFITTLLVVSFYLFLSVFQLHF